MDYVWELLGGFSLVAVFTMVVPLVSWMFGLAEAYTFAVSFVSSFCLLGFGLLSCFLGYNFINICNGQTTSERAKRIKDYDCGYVHNIRDVFGKRWQYSWISPFIPSTLPGNGIDFVKKSQFENIKDM